MSVATVHYASDSMQFTLLVPPVTHAPQQISAKLMLGAWKRSVNMQACQVSPGCCCRGRPVAGVDLTLLSVRPTAVERRE
jgi:hypothetical protein